MAPFPYLDHGETGITPLNPEPSWDGRQCAPRRSAAASRIPDRFAKRRDTP